MAEYGRRAPYGARGLKWLWVGLITQADESRPVWGAWIEIPIVSPPVPCYELAPRMGRGDCKFPGRIVRAVPAVAPRMGRVD